jgi:hypothetical protein
MPIETHIRAGTLGDDIARIAGEAARTAQNVAHTVGQAAAPVVRDVGDAAGRTVRDPNFWTWPFSVTR